MSESKKTEWLLQGPAWVEYRTRLDLLKESEDDPSVFVVRQRMIVEPQVSALVDTLRDFPGLVLSSHKSASQSFHRLNFLVDIGLRANDPGMEIIISKILAHQSQQGPFQLPMNISTSHGGSDEVTWAWALCDAPLLVYALVKLGLGENPAVQKATSYLIGLVAENGWHCITAPELKFRGPGRKDDPCPYATLAMLKLLALIPELIESTASRIGTETLLELWEYRKEKHPYIFYMGTDFCKLKAPLIWYDILHVLDVLSNFPAATSDLRYREMLDILKAKADAENRFTLESQWQAWKEWEFGQKKVPSRWLTFLVERIIARS
jgi:hypothetical protein